MRKTEEYAPASRVDADDVMREAARVCHSVDDDRSPGDRAARTDLPQDGPT
jgi:hypothetical protein